MTDDIVTQLRGECQCSDDCRLANDPCIPMRAADEIERLREQVRWSSDRASEWKGLASQTLAVKHIRHSRFCNCLNDASECCNPNCECHQTEGEQQND